MPSAATLEILIKARDQASRAMQNMSGRARGLGNRLSSLGRVAKTAGAALAKIGVVAGVVAAAIGAKVVGSVVDFETQMQKVNTVFGDSLGVVQEWSKGAAAGMGVSQQRAQQMAASIGDILKPLGFAEREAAKFGTQATDAAAALAFFNSVPTEQAAQAVQSALVGEREALKTLGVVISEADVQARLAAKGQEELTGEAMKQAKALATLELITDGSTDAQNAYAKAQDTARGNINKLKSQLFTLRDRGFQALIPVVGKAAKFLGEQIPRGIDALKSSFSSLTSEGGALNKFATTVALGLGVERGSKDLIGFGSTVKAIFREIGARVMPVLRSVGEGFVELGGRLLEIAREVGPSVIDVLTTVGDLLQEHGPTVIDVARNVAEFALELAAAVAESGFLQTALAGVQTILQIVIPIVVNLVHWMSENQTMLKAVAIALGIVLVALNPIPAAILGVIFVVGLLAQHWDSISAKTKEIWNGIKDFLTENWQEIVSIASLILLGPAGLVVLFTTNAFGIRDKVTGAFTSLKDNVAEKLGLLPGIVAEQFGLVRDKVNEWLGWPDGTVWADLIGIASGMFTLGTNIVRGLWAGIVSLKDWIFGKVSDLAGGILDSAIDGLGALGEFLSPKTRLGVEIGEGLGLGIEAGVQNILPRVRGAGNALLQAIQTVAGSAHIQAVTAALGGDPMARAADKLRSVAATRDALRGLRTDGPRSALEFFNQRVQQGITGPHLLRELFGRGSDFAPLRDVFTQRLRARGFRFFEDFSVGPAPDQRTQTFHIRQLVVQGSPREALDSLGLPS